MTSRLTGKFRKMMVGVCAAVLVLSAAWNVAVAEENRDGFSFIVTADMRNFAEPKYQTPQYFLGTCLAIRQVGRGAFMVSTGDIDPPAAVYETIRKTLGADYPWYPVVGNHEAETSKDMAWIRRWARRGIPHVVRMGPTNGVETTYSFEIGPVHAVVINEYYTGRSDTKGKGNIVPELLAWLKADLAANRKPYVFVFGHEPLVSMPDADTGRMRHKGDNLDAYPTNSFRFQQVLKKYKVTAFVCGHTHNCSWAKINGLWQVDPGHCRGIGDKGAPSTFLKFRLADDGIWHVDVYRDDMKGGPYRLRHTFALD